MTNVKAKAQELLQFEEVNKKRFFSLAGLLFILVVFSGFLKQKTEKVFFDWIQFTTYEERRGARNRVLALKYQKAKPLRVRNVEEPDLEARSAMMILIKNGEERTLLEKEADKPLPIASLTKLMTALITLENYDLNQKITFSEKAAEKEGGPNFFKEGETFYIKDLLYSTLVESSNRAAFALAEVMGKEKFVQKMNEKAQELGMNNTRFFTVTGLDPEFPHEIPNYSTPNDLTKLAREIAENKLIRDICRTKRRDIYTAAGWFHHEITTTNKMIEEVPGLILAKTGQTPKAKGCLLLAWRNEHDNNLIIATILGAEDNFEDMRKLKGWINKGYKW